jgi:hypothetical protein
MKSILAGTAALLCVAAQAQVAPAPKPVVKVGDVAIYAVKLIADRQATEDVVTITGVEGGRITARYARANRSPVETEAVYSDEWGSIVVGGSGARVEPAAQLLNFPLEVGKAWDIKYALQSPSGAKSRIELSNKVLSHEKVTTPAGEFDAYKIENSGWVNGVSWVGAFKIVQTVWYAPAVNRMVRAEFKEYRRDGNETLMELKSFTPAK